MKPIERLTTAVYPISGFTEHPGQPNGMDEIWFDILRAYTSETVTINPPLTWDCDFKKIVRRAVRMGIRHVVIVAYSWGAGWTAQRMAQMFAKYGVRVDRQILIDPVYRPLWMPAWMGANPLTVGALFKNSDIEVCDNVEEVHYCVQKETVPSGHKVCREPFATRPKIYGPIVIEGTSHTQIDNHPTTRQLITAVLDSYFHPQP